ncbi:MAG TPA: hypothetical protein VNR89_00855 [Roseomonas sp.]|nr:hypothetical protein [Roseomonas sp.]
MSQAQEERDAELDLLLRRAGITIPPERYAGVLNGYRDLQAALPLLRSARTAAAEPAGTFVLDTVTRERTP